ncbi:CDP-glycerol--glycerophosphate glycerophosphotransferase [Latilactobacillus sakei]|uniref:CDP-glycerol glycerophosphotransferase family protein n=1 Tax=Latilactobacillus sakei TaxID=1599 RepID=UPI0015F37834|nr:CDP-glycerol glycerophosphotransferase family protein [Latilactobacillus sakei]QMU87078.1 CDP-glycerol glycerophosphotransferase family protein [Latilactobacillus sakei]UNC18985.1 CDP-glycerol--glycerophosphate glycerophosphotransferase [Latilactobacillus sakei]
MTAIATVKAVLYHRVWFGLIKLVTPMSDETFFINSFFGKSFSGNPRALFEGLIEKFPNSDYIIVLNDEQARQTVKAQYPDINIQFVARHEKAYLKALARAKYWIMDINFPFRLKPHKNGVFVQTWHGTPLKHIGNDLPDDNDFKRLTAREPLNWDYFVSNAPEDNWLYERAFNLKQTKIMSYGLPRNDYLAKHKDDRELVASLKAKLQLDATRKTILYAPTFRDDEPTFKLALDLEQFEAQLGDQYDLLIRLHPNVAEQMPDIAAYPHVHNVNRYASIEELYLAADVLMTDYSSVFFDYALLEKPIVFYAYDLDKYQAILRGFYFDYQAFIPGPLVTDNQALYTLLSQGLTAQTTKAFNQLHNANTDGSATQKIIQEVWKV